MSAQTANPGWNVSLVAMLGAGIIMAHQVAAKATRDSVFLNNFDATALPSMVIGAAATAVALGFLASRLITRFTPRRIVPWAFAFSGLLQIGEWRLLAGQPKLAAVLIYLHLVALGAVLLSSYWSVINELLDPHTAKQRFGQIAGAGTAGGILGGLVAERVAVIFSSGSVLLWLAFLHFSGAVALALMRRTASLQATPAARPRKQAGPGSSARQAFSKAPYLFSLALLVVIGTSSAAAVDWVFKSEARAYFGPGEGLTRFFLLFHTSVQVLSLLAQTLATRFFLEKLGLGRTVGTLPVTVALGGVGALFFFTFPVLTALRAGESVLRGSLFRSGYELFYTPIPVAEKRRAKQIIDVGMDRLGDAVGGGITQLFLFLGATAAPNRILLTVVGIALAGIFVARRLDRGYVQALEKSLMNRAVELDLDDIRDSTTRLALIQTSGHIPVVTPPPLTLPPSRPASPPSDAARTPAEAAKTPQRTLEPLLQRLSDLRSGRIGRVRVALLLSDPLDPLLTPQVISLLAWDEAAELAREVLTKAAPRITGQLTDCLLDDTQDFAIRRRIPRVLAGCAEQRAADGLAAALADGRFEVRFQAGRALAAVTERNPEIRVNRERIFAVVAKELSVSRSVWDGHRLLDRRDPSEQTSFLDEVLRERAHSSLEHVFTLLALVLPRDPLKVAFRALHTDDPLLRGLALEYLETVLPDEVKEKMTEIVSKPTAAQTRSGDEILASLMQSNQSVVLRLQQKLDQPPQ